MLYGSPQSTQITFLYLFLDTFLKYILIQNNSIGKVFNSILNNRLDKCLVENNIIHENQIGFSKKSRTSDHIFVLKCILEKYLKTDTKSYLCALWTSIKHLILLFIPALDINLLEMV
jgi:hypothetical protein